MTSVDDLIKQVKDFFSINDRIKFNTPAYEKFHNELQSFIYENHFDNTPEWEIISNNLIYKSNQYMAISEANSILVQLELLKRRVLAGEYNPMWDYIHPKIVDVSKSRYDSGHYDDAARSAFVEINARVKRLYRKLMPATNEIPDGTDLMHKVFGEKHPLLSVGDLNTESGSNIQQGFHFMLAGAMSALRNPPSHSNNIQLTPQETIRQLIFASMLMYKIDEAVEYSQTDE